MIKRLAFILGGLFLLVANNTGGNQGLFWAVCSATSSTECEAFMAAPCDPNVAMGYPINDGGYWQTLNGRSAYLSRQLTSLCR